MKTCWEFNIIFTCQRLVFIWFKFRNSMSEDMNMPITFTQNDWNLIQLQIKLVCLASEIILKLTSKTVWKKLKWYETGPNFISRTKVKSLKIPKGESEAIKEWQKEKRGQNDKSNIGYTRERTKTNKTKQTHKQNTENHKDEEHRPHKNTEVNPGAKGSCFLQDTCCVKCF
jgi:hypothetical protein